MTIFLVIVALLGNLLLFTGAIFGDLKDNSIAWILVIAAICIDIWLIVTVISNHQPREKTGTSRNSHNSTTSTNSSLEKKRQEVIQGLNPQIQEKNTTIKAIYEFEQKFTRIDNLLNLISELTDSQNDNPKYYFEEYKELQFNNILPSIVKTLPEPEKNRFPTDYFAITDYKKTIRTEQRKLLEKKRQIENATSKHEIDKIIGKGYKRPLRIVIVSLCIFFVVSLIVNLSLYNSNDYTIWKAKEDCKNNFEIANIIKDNCDVSIDNVKIYYENEKDVYISSYSKNVEYKYIFTADCNDYSKYYTTNNNSKQAQELHSKMLEIYNALKPVTYTYNHPNGWEVTFRFYGKFTIRDSNGHTYEYKNTLNNDKWATIKVDNTEITNN